MSFIIRYSDWKEFWLAENGVMLLIANLFWLFMAYYYISLYGANKKSNIMTIIFGLSVVLNIILVIIFTPLWGLRGTALATFFAYSAAVLLLSYFKKRFLK